MLHYIKRLPKTFSENPPLLILLHGYGSNEEDLFSFAEELPDDLLIISAQAPHTMGHGAYAWYSIDFDAINGKFSNLEEARDSVEKIAEFIDTIVEKYKVNEQKIFLLGFSQGAILSYATTFKYPNKVQHVIALSGYINKELLPDVIDVTTDYYISHGTVDQVLPIEWARDSYELLKKMDLSVDYSEYPVGHGVAPQNFYSFKKWIQDRL